MKKLFAIFATLVLVALAIPAPANAAAITNTITLFEPTHRQLDGKFIDDDLASLLTPVGALGSLVFDPPRGNRMWNIDAALVEEVVAMSHGYELVGGEPGTGEKVAADFLAQLLLATSTDTIFSLPYGNPSGYWIHRLSPHDENYFLTAGKLRLQNLLGRPVSALTKYPSYKYFKLSSDLIATYKDAGVTLQTVARYLSSSELDNYRLHSAALLTPHIETSRRDYLEINLTAQSFALMHAVSVVPGRFTITASQQKLPITVINNFNSSAQIHLRVSSLNSKVRIGKLPLITLAPKSKTQILVPVEVLTSGSSALAIDALTPSGKLLGESVLFPLNLAVISPIATWITTTAALVLFGAAVIQSIRRFRRRGK
jgi:hypothetical protein